MPEGLIDLTQRVAAASPKPELKVAPQTVPAPKRGDDLMASALAHPKVDSLDSYGLKLFHESQDMVQAKADEDPEFAKRIDTQFSQFKGGDPKYAEKMIDEADAIKIEALKQQNPDWFGYTGAARTGFLNSITFGQLSKIKGKAGELIEGTPYEEFVSRESEKVRLLHKAFPGTTLAAEAATFLIPGSPVKALFSKGAAMGLKVAGNIAPSLARFAANPTLLQKTIRAAAEGFGGAMAVSAPKNFAGTDFQEFSLDRGVGKSLSEGAMVGAVSALLPVGASGVGAIARGTKAAAQKVSSGMGSLTEAITGTSSKAVRAYRANPELIENAAGSESQVGEDLLDFLWNQKKSRLPEHDAADKLLDSLPEVDVSRVTTYLRSVKPTKNPSSDAVTAKLHAWADRIEATLPKAEEIIEGTLSNSGGLLGETGVKKVLKSKISARNMRLLIDDLQDEAADSFGKESGKYIGAIKIAARRARIDLLEAASKNGGDPGKNYIDLMNKVADKTRVLKYIGKQLGRSEEIQAQNAERFVGGIFNKNKTYQQKRLAELDGKFGTNFLELAENASFAKQLGPQGKPQFFPSQTTGRTQLGTTVGEAVGAVVGGVIGAFAGNAPGAVGGLEVGRRLGKAAGTAASSPRMQSMVLGTSDKISGFANYIFQKPEVLSSLAGKVLRVPGQPPVRVPEQVKELAKELTTTLEKDGPVSAGGTLRIIADTPYFVGLVHYFEIADRHALGNAATKAVAGQNYSDEIAVQPKQ